MASGCSVWMASHQADHHDLSVLKPGHTRGQVLAELGQPTATETRMGKNVDIFSFRQGQDPAFNFGRTVGYGVADFFTLGIFEVVGTPTEMVLAGDIFKLEVHYDADDRVEEVI